MANLDSLISVQVSVGAPGVTVEGFGTILIATDGATGFAANETRVYTTPESIDGDADLDAQTKVEAKAVFNQSPSPDRVKVGNYNPANPIDTELAAIEAGDADWYGLCVTGTKGFTEADILLVAAWVESRSKLYAAQSSDAAVTAGTAGNIAEDLNTASYSGTFLTWHSVNTEPAAVQALASLLAVNPDVATTILAHKILPGIPKQTQLTDTQIANILADKANVYSEVKGLGSYQKGTAGSGNFADIRLTQNWMEARMEEAIAQVLSDFSNRGSKVPYDDTGIALFENVARRVLRNAVRANHIVRDSEVVDAPLFKDVLPADRTARILRLSFSATLAGAIQEAAWTGTLEIGT